MKNLRNIAAIAMAATLATGTLAGCSNNNAQPTTSDVTPVQTTAAVFTSEAVTFTEPVTEATTETETVTEPAEDLTSIPDRSEFLGNVFDNLNSATSFRMVCNVKGKIPSNSSDMGSMIDHQFTYTVANNKSHLESSYVDLNTDEKAVTYEEYQILEDNIVTTLTQHGNDWVDNTPKEMIRTNMMLKALNTTPLLGILANDVVIASETFPYGEISRDENGNYLFTDKAFEYLCPQTPEFREHLFSGLIRTPAIDDCLSDIANGETDSGIVYTFDKNFNLISMSFDIIVRQTNGYDLHCDIKFDRWNDIPGVNTPSVSKITTETEAAESEAADAETETTAE